MMINFKYAAIALLTVGILLGCSSGKPIMKTDAALRGQMYESPEQALAAIKAAFNSGDPERLVDIFGEEGRNIIVSGDLAADKRAMKRASRRLDERAELIPVSSLEHPEEQWYKLRFGIEGWNMRIPLINRGQGWYFETRYAKDAAAEARREINEVNAVSTLVELVAAQNRYQRGDYDGDGVKEYAQKILSTPGSKDGLYWEPAVGGTSPLEELVEEAIDDGYDASGKSKSYEGYVYRVLPAQGKFARGGQRSFMEGENMTKGFGFLAYPVKYNVSGGKTFVVGPDGIIYKKDLGFRTASLTSEMKELNPDRSWGVVEHPDK